MKPLKSTLRRHLLRLKYTDEPRIKTAMHPAILYTTIIRKSKSTSKYFVINHTKILLHKLKNDNVKVTKRKSERDNIKMNKTPRINVSNNNNMKHKILRRNMPFKNQVEPLPTATGIGAITRKHFEKKFKSDATKEECIVKFPKILHKLDKLLHNLKFIKSMMTTTILHAKSNIRLKILHIKGVIITPDPNIMKSNTMASSSSPSQVPWK